MKLINDIVFIDINNKLIRFHKYRAYRSIYSCLRYVFTGEYANIWWSFDYKAEIWTPEKTVYIHNK